MNRERLDTWLERSILGVILAILVWSPLALGATRASEWLVIQGLTIVVLGLWVARAWLAPEPRLLWTPFCWAVLAFVGYTLARYSAATLEYPARQELVRVLVYAALALAVVNNLNRRNTVEIVMLTLVTVGTVIALYAVYQFIRGSEQVWWFPRPPGYRGRGSGTFICPNHLAGYLEMLLPVALAGAALSKMGAARRVMLGYAALAIGAGIAVSISRAGWLAAVAGLAVALALMLQAGKRWLAVAALVLVIGGGGAWFYSQSVLVGQRMAAPALVEAAGKARKSVWVGALRMWADHRWLGAGPAEFDQRYRTYREQHWMAQQRPEHVHNDYLETLAEWGVAGLALVLLAVAAVGWGLARHWGALGRFHPGSSSRTRMLACFVVGAVAGLAALLVHSYFDFNMHIPANAILAVTLLALLNGTLRVATNDWWMPARWPARLALTLALLATAGWLTTQGWQRTREEYWLAKAARAPVQSPGRLTALERAFQVEPMNFDTAAQAGEDLRLASWRGEEGWRELAEQAMTWFQRAAALNPHDSLCRVRYGMCLHWSGRHEEARKWFDRAAELDPNGYYTLAFVAWHYFQLEDYAACVEWAERSWRMNSTSNPIALNYATLSREKLAEKSAALPKPAVPR